MIVSNSLRCFNFSPSFLIWRARTRTSIGRTRNTLVRRVDELGLLRLRAEQLLARVLQVQKSSFCKYFQVLFDLHRSSDDISGHLN